MQQLVSTIIAVTLGIIALLYVFFDDIINLGKTKLEEAQQHVEQKINDANEFLDSTLKDSFNGVLDNVQNTVDRLQNALDSTEKSARKNTMQ